MRLTARDRFVVGTMLIAGFVQVIVGVWAFLAPRSFYDVIATYPPYNEHFIHDIGAFLLGLGTALLAAHVWRDTAFVVLLGSAVAAAAHWVSHVRDHDHGGAASDPWTTGLFAAALVAACVVRYRSVRRDGRVSQQTSESGGEDR